MDHIRKGLRSPTWLVLLTFSAIVSYANGVAATTSSKCLDGGISDGRCDFPNNNANCDYDGGDCCECTCVDSAYTCGPYYICLDPSAGCEDYSHGIINNLGNLNDVHRNGREKNGKDDSSNSEGGSSGENDSSGGGGGNLKVVYGASVGALLVAVIVIAVVYCCYCKRGRTNSAPTTTAAPIGPAAPTEAAAPMAYVFAKTVELETPVKTIYSQPTPSAPYEKGVE